MGGVVHTVMAPIEWAKLLRQTQESNTALPGHPRRQRFQGMVDCVSRTVREEGFLSLWRGNGTGVLRYYPSVALNFSLMDLYRKMFERWRSISRWSLDISRRCQVHGRGCSWLHNLGHHLHSPYPALPANARASPSSSTRKTASAASTRAYLPRSIG